jgi:hypothetical protein
MEPRDIIKTCSGHYKTWKEEALKTENKMEMKKFLDKAFFWLELQNNLLMLWTIENTMGENGKIKEKLEQAQLNVNKKIADYASQVLKDLKQN